MTLKRSEKTFFGNLRFFNRPLFLAKETASRIMLPLSPIDTDQKDLPMIISENAVVLFHYTLTDESGNELDSSTGKDPLAYMHGHKNIIPGLEKELDGKTAGDVMIVTIKAAEADGETQDERIQEIPRTSFQTEEMSVGMRFEAKTPNGPVSVVVTEVNDETVTVDGNHPLAGKDLTFDVRVDSVREASEEELSHGHVHGPGGHNH